MTIKTAKLKALSDRAGTIAKRASKLSIDLRDAGFISESRVFADISHRAAQVDGTLFHDSRK